MRLAYVGDESAVGVDDGGELSNLARMVGSGLHYGNVVEWREAEERFGHADVVVEVSGSGQHAVLAGKDGGGEFLCGRLAVRTRNLHDGCAQHAAVVCGKVLEGLEDIVDKNHPCIAGSHFCTVHNGIGTSVFKSLGSKVIAVETGAAEGEEERAFGAVAGIGRHQRMLLEEPVEFRDFHVFCLLFGGNVPEAGGRWKRE